jgi:hypothetical protein
MATMTRNKVAGHVLVVAALGSCTFAAADPNDPIVDGDMPGTFTDRATDELVVDNESSELLSANGLLSTAPYSVGGLRATGISKRVVHNIGDQWEDIQTSFTANDTTGVRLKLAPNQDWGGGHPRGLGFNNISDEFSVLYEGEIYLKAGSTMLHLRADDVAIVDIKLAASFDRAVAAGWPDPVDKLLKMVPHDGWFPIRIAISEGVGDSVLELGDDSGPFPDSMFRAPIGDEHGFHVDGFSDFLPTQVWATALTTTTFVEDWAYQAPSYEVSPATEHDRFMLRYSGQIRIDVAGSYTFGLTVQDSRDAMRLWIDDLIIGGKWGDTRPAVAPQSPIPALDLSVGWHDIVVDYSNWSGQQAKVSLAIEKAPATVAIGPIKPSMIRPVTRRGRVTGGYGGSDLNLPNNGTVASEIMLPAPPGSRVTSMYTEFRIQTPNPERAQCDVLSPSGDVIDLGPTTVSNNVTQFHSQLRQMAGKLLNATTTDTSGKWKMKCTDLGSTSQATLKENFIAVEYQGGKNPPFSNNATFVSKAHSTPGLVGVNAINVVTTEALPAGATIAIECRSAASDAELAIAPWAPVDGTNPVRLSGDRLQYRFTIKSDGWQQIDVSAVKVLYRFK